MENPGPLVLTQLYCLLLIGKGRLRKDLQFLEKPHGATLEQLRHGLLAHCDRVLLCTFHSLLGAWGWEAPGCCPAGQQPGPRFSIPFLDMDLDYEVLERGKP